MNKKAVVAVLCITLLFLISCTKQAANVGEKKHIGGTEGVVATFEPLGVEENQLQTVFDDETFGISVLVQNKGEKEVPVGKVHLELIGPSRELFQGVTRWDAASTDALDPISEFNPEGGEEIVSFGDDARYTAPVTGFTDLEWFVNYQYDYATEVVISNVCFKGDPTDTRVCTLEERKLFSVSGAPLQVVNVEEDTAGKGVVVLRIDIQNMGKGDSTVIGQEFDTRFDRVAYAIDEPNRWECKAGGRENEARLIDGKATIRCKLKQPLRENELSTKEVKFTLNYQYQDIAQQTLRVKESVR